MFFISIITPFSCDLFLFIFSSSLLIFSLYSSVLFSNSVSILITNDLNCLTCKLFISTHQLFRGFSLILSIEMHSSIISFCLISSVSRKLGETVTYYVLKVCPYVEALLYNLQAPSGFGVRAGFDVNTHHTFLRVCWKLSPG